MADPFPDDVVRQAWRRSGGRCECTSKSHGHAVPCNKLLVWENRGKDGATGCWEAHHVNSKCDPIYSNCLILCCDCHTKTGIFGGS